MKEKDVREGSTEGRVGQASGAEMDKQLLRPWDAGGFGVLSPLILTSTPHKR